MPSEATEIGEGRKLGRLPAKSDTRALMFARFAAPPRTLPKRTNFWPRRKAFPLRSFGNTDYGDCTRAKQAVAAMRMERLETRRTPVITDEEVVRVYFEMTNRLYGGGDTGAYETDALSAWRRPEETFRDTKGRPLTIDAYLRVNHLQHDELRTALVVAGPKGFPFCINLPKAFQQIRPPLDWDVPTGQPLIGDWMPGSWGGHSMWAFDYDEVGLWHDHTWNYQPQRLTWRAVAAFLDEAHSVVDSLDAWRAKNVMARRSLDWAGIKKAVNAVSSQKVA